MKKLLLIAIVIGGISCSKEDKEYCYECKMANSSSYSEFGCMTEKEWDDTQVTDQYGQLLDKGRDCRKK